MEAIVVAFIAATGGILASLVQKGRRENREDHNVVEDMIKTLNKDVNNVSRKIDSHIEWHLDKTQNK